MPAIHISLSAVVLTSVVGYLILLHIRQRQLLNNRLSCLSDMAHGSPIMLSKTKEPRFVVLRSALCASTTITMDLLQFHEAVAIVERYVHLHGCRK